MKIVNTAQTIRLSQPQWLEASRKKNWDAYLQYLPNRKNERWKYADLTWSTKSFVDAPSVNTVKLTALINSHRLKNIDSILLVLVNGCYVAALSDLKHCPQDILIEDLQTAFLQHAELIEQHWQTFDAEKYPFAALNEAKWHDGLFIYVPSKISLNMPIHVLSINTGAHENFAIHPRHFVLIEREAKLTFFEEHLGVETTANFTNAVTFLKVQQSAHLDYYKIQKETSHAIHLAHLFVEQAQDSNTSFLNVTTGGLFARDEVAVKLNEPGANCKTNGFYLLNHDHQYGDQHVEINHLAAHSQSEMLYKGILDKQSRAVFNGRLYIAPHAQKILAYQANHNLLLSNNAEVYSKPELEIYADDIKCKHGATTGQIDQDALFYLRARGIPEKEATHILLQGFIGEIMQRIQHEAIKKRIKVVLRYL